MTVIAAFGKRRVSTRLSESVLICVNVRPTPRVNSGKQLWHRTGIDLKCNCSGFFFFLFFVW